MRSSIPEVKELSDLLNSINSQVALITSPDTLTTYFKTKFKETIVKLKKIIESNGLTESTLEQIMEGINQLMPSFRVKMLYRPTYVNELTSYQNMSLEDMFINNIVLYERDFTSLNGGIGGSCVNWAILFYKLLQEIGLSQKVEVRYIRYEKFSDHIGIIVRMGGDCYIIDPFTRIGEKTGKTVKKVKVRDKIHFLNDSVFITQTHPSLKIEAIENTQEIDGDILKYIKEKEYLSFITFSFQKKLGFNLLFNNPEQKFILAFEIGQKDITFFIDKSFIISNLTTISEFRTSAEIIKFILSGSDKKRENKKKYPYLNEIIDHICEFAPVNDILMFILYKIG